MPPIPPLSPLRLASPSDVLRIGIVQASGFRYSSVFDWEKPSHAQFPEDTLLSYRTSITAALKDSRKVVVVALDKYDPLEAEKSKAVIPREDDAERPREGEEVVVGCAVWGLEEGSTRKGQLKNENGEYPSLAESLNRDEHALHCQQLSEADVAATKKYFHGHMMLDSIVVHPAYWKRGHGERLTRWGMALAHADVVKLGVIAAPMGCELNKRLGWTILDKIHLEDDAEVLAEFTDTVMEYLPPVLPA